MATITDQMTEIYCFVDDYLKAHLQLHDWRDSPNNHPQFTDAEVLTIALMQGCLGVDNLKQSYKLIAENYRDAFPQLCCYTQWINRLHLLSPQIGALLCATCGRKAESEALYLVDSKPIPLCHPLRHGRVRLLRDEGAWFGKTAKGWFFGFKLHAVLHVDGRILNLILTPGNWNDRDPALALFDEIAGSGSVALGDSGYSGERLAKELEEDELDLLLINRSEAGPRWKFLLSQVRQRIETAFSRLWSRFIDRVFSRSWQGLWNSIQLKALHYNLCHARLLPSLPNP
jgi:hypothetical protein